MRQPLIERFRERLPVSERTPIVSLREGSTPLIPLKGPPEARARGVQLYAKYEGLNPTGSFKDRGMTLAVSKALEAGAQAVACASTGNTSASAAAYASGRSRKRGCTARGSSRSRGISTPRSSWCAR